MVTTERMVQSIFHVFDRTAEKLSAQAGRDGHTRGPEFRTEAATTGHRDQVELVTGHFQRASNQEDKVGQRYGIRVDGEHPRGRVVIGHRTHRLQGLSRGSAPANGLADHDICVSELAIDIAKRERAVQRDIRLHTLVE